MTKISIITACAFGTFGLNCSKLCSCDSPHCHHVNGACNVTRHVNDTACDNDLCADGTNGTFGNCSALQFCSGECDSANPCLSSNNKTGAVASTRNETESGNRTCDVTLCLPRVDDKSSFANVIVGVVVGVLAVALILIMIALARARKMPCLSR